MSDLTALSASALCDRLCDGSVTALDALDAFEQRYREHNPALNAIISTDFDAARKRAGEADAARSRGERWGPLHGLPMTLKDNIETAHLRTSYGVADWRDYRPPTHADVAQLVTEAGAIIFGKTNLPALGTDTQTFNEVHGQTNNPWNLAYTPGGSSGGAAAALAAGLTPLEIGNDIGGSIRLPAHFCGLYGHKASYGLVSAHGPKPWEAEHAHFPLDVDLLSTGPLARSARDLALAMDVIAGPASNQRTAFRAQLADSRVHSLGDFRVGVWLDDPGYETDPAMGDVLQRAVDALASAGANIVTRKPNLSLQRSHQLRNELEATTLSYTCPQDTYDWALQNAQDTPAGRSALTWAQSVSMRCRDWHSINRERLIMQQHWHEYFQSVDVLLCPVARINAHEHDHTPITERSIDFCGESSRYWPIIGPWNALALVAYLPATVAPVGQTPNGLPVGLQIIGPYMEDRTPIRFAELIEEHVAGEFQFPDGFAP